MRAEPDHPPCPLCAHGPWPDSINTRQGRFRHCLQCQLIFRDPDDWLDPAAERAFYETHENAPDDPGYRRFLGQLVEPLMGRLTPASRGLDFGCGPGPALAALLRERGFPMATWDPFFLPDPKVLEYSYDFITATEVLEHLHRPGAVLPRLRALLSPGGHLGLMTELRREIGRFSDWWYTRDPTHVCFYAPETMQWIARRLDMTIEHMDRRVVIMQGRN